MAVAKRPAPDAAEATVPARVSRRRRRMVMRLRIMRSGNSLGAQSDALAAGTGGSGEGGAEAAAAAASVMDDKLKVCSDLPNDVLCKILLLVGMPVAKSFQLQLVNRQWRQVLTSADFRQQSIARRDDMLVACVPLGRRSLALGDTGRNSKQSPAARVVDIDLSFLPDGFWSSQPSSYAVVAVGGGLVCISDAKGCLRSGERLCVLNPLTRTCKAVPPVPLPQTGASGVEVTHLHAGALTVLWDTVACRSGPRLRDWVLATYDLEAARPGQGNANAGEWTLVRALPGLAAWSHPVSTRHLVECEGRIYLYHERKVYVHAVSPAAGDAFVETAEVGVPATPSHMAALGDQKVALVECRGRVFFMAPLDGHRAAGGLWRIWMLALDCESWHRVAELGRPEFNRLTGFRYADCNPVTINPIKACAMESACAAGDMLCSELRFRLYVSEDMMGDHGRPGTKWRTMWRAIMMGFSLQTRRWELVYDHEWLPSSDEAFSFELMPNSFL